MSEMVEVNPNENYIKKYLPAIILLVGLGLAALVLGYGVGKVQTPKTNSTKSTIGQTTTLKAKTYSVNYPKDWVLTEHTENEAIGAKISFRGNSVEFWIDKAMEYHFTEAQKSNQTGQKDSALTVDGRSAKMTNVSFKNGSSFISVLVPPGDKTPSVIFWAFSSDGAYTKKVTDIISSFKHL